MPPSASLLDLQPVVLLTGVSASGKSTVADALARRFDRGVHVRGDVFRRMIVAGREEMTADPTAGAWEQLRLRYRLGAATADTYHRAGFAVVVQDVIIGPVLEEYVGMIGSRPRVVVVLCPSVEVVVEREAGRPKTAYRDGFDSAAALDRALRHDTPRVGLWLDTSALSVAETVEAIVERALDEGQVA